MPSEVKKLLTIEKLWACFLVAEVTIETLRALRVI